MREACVDVVYILHIHSRRGHPVFLARLQFEWDEEKARTNLKKHGVMFESACEIFFDPLVLIRDAGDADEPAQIAIGETSRERLLYVVHLVKREERIRIVSARPVIARERREYES